MPVLNHFDIIAPFYDRVIGSGTFELLIKIADLPVRGNLLDAGGGTGRVAQALRGLAGHLVIADLSLAMLRQANQKSNLETICSSTENLPFLDNTFERIILVDALHHVYSHRDTTGELWRVLKPGGRLVIEEPNIRKGLVKLVAIAEKLALMRSHFISPSAIAKLFVFPGADARIHYEGYSAWVIVTKEEVI